MTVAESRNLDKDRDADRTVERLADRGLRRHKRQGTAGTCIEPELLSLVLSGIQLPAMQIRV